MCDERRLWHEQKEYAPYLYSGNGADGKNLERLASMCGYREIGMVVDKLTREKMISLHTDTLMPRERKGKQI